MPYRPNPGFKRAIGTDPAFKATLRAAGEEVKSKASELMPRGSAHKHMADQFFVHGTAGYVVKVGNRDPFFFLAEFGSANNPPYAPLRRAARMVGLGFIEASKT